jgi:putative FmdB family regulatory protein
MPIYEYECRKCGHGFDVLQKVSDGPLRKCPECGALKLQRLISAPQFRLKGTGWYETDFKKDGKKRLVESGDGKPAAEGDKSAPADKADKPEKKAVTEKSAGKAGASKSAGTSAD